MQTNVNLDDLGTGKSDNFVIQQKFSPIDKFRNESIIESLYCVKIGQIRSFFWPAFSRIWTEYGEIRSKYGKIRARKNSVFGHFSRSVRALLALERSVVN